MKLPVIPPVSFTKEIKMIQIVYLKWHQDSKNTGIQGIVIFSVGRIYYLS